jgi:hypothetical protein
VPAPLLEELQPSAGRFWYAGIWPDSIPGQEEREVPKPPDACRRSFLVFARVLVGLSLAAGCSGGDSSPGQDSKVAPGLDAKIEAGGDMGPVKPDGPKGPGTWKTVTASGPAGWSLTATLLKSGKVLVAGGCTTGPTSGIDKPLAATYLFDPSSGAFQSAGDLTHARCGHDAVLLDSGKVLLVGGDEGDYYKTIAAAELFDPQKPAGSAWSSAGSMSMGRYSGASVKLASGKVLVGGGSASAGPTKSFDLYDPGSNSFSTPGALMKTARSNHTMTLLANGKVLIAGGLDGQNYLSALEVYDPSAGSVSTISAALTEARAGHRAVHLASGRVLIVGGICDTGCQIQGNELIDPTTNTVTAVSSPGTPPRGHEATLLDDGRVLVTGGAESNLKAATAYNPTSGGDWSTLTSMSQGRYVHAAVRLSDGSVLVVGGADQNDAPVATAERFSP